MRNALTRFLQLESASGLLLIGAAVLAMTINNSPLSFLYNGLLDVPVAVQIGALQIAAFEQGPFQIAILEIHA